MHLSTSLNYCYILDTFHELYDVLYNTARCIISSILPVMRLDMHMYESRNLSWVRNRKKLLRPPSVKNYTGAYFSVVFLKYLRLCAYYFINNIIKSVIFNFLNFTPYAYHNTSVIERIRIITITIISLI